MLTVALALPALLGMVGLALDVGRLYATKARLQAAVDAAALAGALRLHDDPDLRQPSTLAMVADFLNRNYPRAQLVGGLQPCRQERTLSLTAQVIVPMTFLRVLGIRERTVRASACAGFERVEIVLVVDNSSSMRGGPIRRLREAASRMVDLLIPGDETPSVKVGLVPFRGKVRVGPNVDGLPAGCRNWDGSLNLPINDQDDSCFGRQDTEAIPEILPLSYNKDRINRSLAKLKAPGRDIAPWAASGTVIAEGIKWARHVLTPEPPYTEGGSPDLFRKLMIVISDGQNVDGTCGEGPCDPRDSETCEYRRNAYFGAGRQDCLCENGCLDSEAIKEAALAESEGIEIFTIRYASFQNRDPHYVDFLKALASSRPNTEDHFFNARREEQLDEIFDNIRRQIGFRLIR